MCGMNQSDKEQYHWKVEHSPKDVNLNMPRKVLNNHCNHKVKLWFILCIHFARIFLIDQQIWPFLYTKHQYEQMRKLLQLSQYHGWAWIISDNHVYYQKSLNDLYLAGPGAKLKKTWSLTGHSDLPDCTVSA